jgi:hypothetical protein
VLLDRRQHLETAAGCIMMILVVFLGSMLGMLVAVFINNASMQMNEC